MCVLGPYLQHMEVLRLGVKSELQLQASAAATEMLDLSSLFDHQQLRAMLDP